MKPFILKPVLFSAVLTLLLLGAVGENASAADTLAADALPVAVSPENASVADTQDVLRAYLQVQEQLHNTQLALERNRRDAEDMAARNHRALTDQMSVIEKALGEQRASNYWVLGIGGLLAGLGILAMLVTTFMQMRTMNRFTKAAFHLPLNQSFALGGGNDPKLLGSSVAGEASARLLETIARLEKRIRELENGKFAPPTLAVVGQNGAEKNFAEIGRIEILLGKGQSLLSGGQTEEAAAVFDEVLALNPQYTEALIKKGAALEKLSKLDEAIACYDRAIAVDNSVTIAYLYKGGVFNRLERYHEALACYEQALKTQEKAHAG